ncbi:NAD(P)H-hydrate dehydratase [bacterium]|nr:NAD(P)H-hydrate dehydratase [candidate division CSSED10-310 bacterium]
MMRGKPIVTGEQMKELDRKTIQEIGIPGVVLMENAGRETVRAINTFFELPEDASVTVVAGKGNNGGDGFVVARHLSNQNFNVVVVLLGRQSELKGDAKINAEIAVKMGIPVYELLDDGDLAVLEVELENADLIVDSIFGTGLTKPPSGIYASAINAINTVQALTVSVDIPSGIFADASVVDGPAVYADLTVTFGLPKPSLLLYPAAGHTGQLVVADISIPPDVIHDIEPAGRILSPCDFHNILRTRPPNSHKGMYGHLLIVAGSPGKTGAAALAAEAALRAGTGLVTVAIPESLNSILEVKLTEAMTLPVKGIDGNIFGMESFDVIVESAKSKTALLIGPGIGLHSETQKFMRTLLKTVRIPIIIDADGLTLMAEQEPPWSDGEQSIILTPHPGEMSRLTGINIPQMLSDQISVLKQFTQRIPSHVILKTARTIIMNQDGSWLLNITGNPGLASGGTGDVLAGLVSGFVAQKFAVEEAVAAAVFLHGLAADIAIKDIGVDALLASDLLSYLNDARQFALENPEVFDGALVPPLQPLSE